MDFVFVEVVLSLGDLGELGIAEFLAGLVRDGSS